MACSWVFIIIILEGLGYSVGSICMSWKPSKDSLLLTCKVDKLRFPMYFTNPGGTELAYCLTPIPSVDCSSHYQNTSISQDLPSYSTTIRVEGHFQSKQHNGNWSCHHGKAGETADALIRVPDSIVIRSYNHIIVTGPQYVRKGEEFNIICTGTIVPLYAKASFALNGNFYTNITWSEAMCSSTLTSSTCTPDKCQCNQNGKSFVIRYTGWKEEILSFTCSMEFETIGVTGDCTFVDVIDLKGPTIETNTSFPLTADSVVQLTCIVTSVDHTSLQLNFDCGDKYIAQNYNRSSDFESTIILKVTPEENNTVCQCTTRIGRYGFYAKLILTVKQVPVLVMDRVDSCLASSTVVLRCGISTNPTHTWYRFAPWTHRFNGFYIRNLTGNTNGHVATLKIDSCSYFDTGDYTCNLMARDGQTVVWISKASRIVVNGPPKIIKTERKTANYSTLVVQFYSVPEPFRAKWFISGRQINDSAKYTDTMDEDTVLYQIYGRTVTSKLYVTTLIMLFEAEEKLLEIHVMLSNEIGNTTVEFFIHSGFADNEIGQLTEQIILLMMIGIPLLLLIVPFFVFILRRTCRKGICFSNRREEIYYAAPQTENEVQIYTTLSAIAEINDQVPERIANANDDSGGDKESSASSDYLDMF